MDSKNQQQRRYARRTVDTSVNPLIDHLIQQLELKNDAALARKLHMQAPAISKIRHGVLNVSGDVLVRIHDITGLSIDYLRNAAGMDKPNYATAETA